MPDDLQDIQPGKKISLEMGALALLVVVFLTISLLVQKPFSQDTAEGTMKAFGKILAAGITLIMYSFLYRDNPLYKIAENLYVGVALGYQVMIIWRKFLKRLVYNPIFHAPTTAALQEALMYKAVPIILGVLLLTRLSRKHSWLSRYSYAFLVGWAAGLAIPQVTHTSILSQLYAAVAPLQDAITRQPEATSWFTGVALPIFGAIAVLVGTVAVLWYFFFSVEHKRVGAAISRLGVWFLMVSFGASFGYTVMGRLSLLIGRVQFLLFEWLKIKAD